MASYYPSFTYMGINSLKDKKLIVIAFDPDQGEMDTFLGMDCIYTDKYDGSRRLDYGAKFNSTAMIKISVMKASNKDFTVAEVRDFLKWTTGVRQNSYLDLLVGNEVKFSFLGRVTNAYQRKIDSRTIGLSIEFTSVSPWAYSPIQRVGYYPNQAISVDTDGAIYKKLGSPFEVGSGGVLCNDINFSVENNGTIFIDTSSIVKIDNKTDDLYTPVYLNTVFKNDTSNTLSIKNLTSNEETVIRGLAANEVVTLSENQFILSDKSERVFGDDFNFVWPKLNPGVNNFLIDANGNGSVEFTYRYPIKIGDCTIDVNDLNNMCDDYVYDYDDDNTSSGNGGSGTISGKVSWSDITNTPTTLGGYGITNAYTKSEIDSKMDDIECDHDDIDVTIDDQALSNMLEDIFG